MQLAAALIAATFASPGDVATAKADYQAQYAAGEECRYLELGPDPEAALPVVQFIVVLASREPLLDHIVPAPMPGTNLVRIRLNRLRWSVADWSAVAGYERNPYTPYQNPLIIPAGYLVDRIADGTVSDAYLRLYFGGRAIPKTLDEFLKATGVDPAKQRGLELRWVEAESRVNVARDAARLILSLDGVNATSWITYDVKRVARGTDPLEALFENKFRADGIEAFSLVPKVHTNGIRGIFPVMVLADGDGKLVNEAPVDLVVDSTEFAGQTAIRTPGSCFTCHTKGSQATTTNALRDRLKAGVELKSYDKNLQTAIELSHLGDLSNDLGEWDQGYAAALLAVNGLTPAANAEAFAAYHRDYLAPVTLERAAAELHCTAEDLSLALAYASANGVKVSVRLAGLAHGKALPRSSFEDEFYQAAQYIRVWRSK